MITFITIVLSLTIIGIGLLIKEITKLKDELKEIHNRISVTDQQTHLRISKELEEVYELHNDFIGKSGNRTHSFLIYLNDDFKGGETKFIKQDRIVTPETGKGLLWTNTIDGELLKDSEHAGLPVTEGYKYILIIWVRENKFV